MMVRCLRGWVLAGLLLVVVPGLMIVPEAQAGHVTIDVNGDLTDLIAAITANQGFGEGGFRRFDPEQDTWVSGCAYDGMPSGFENLADVESLYVLLDFKEADGSFSDHTDLYAGFLGYGYVGDLDGDGDANTFTPTSPGAESGCTDFDNEGIASNEFYRILFNLDCTGAPEMAFAVTDNGVYQVNPASGAIIQAIPDGEFGYTNGTKTLELYVPNIEQYVPEGYDDLCVMEIDMFVGALFDGPGEDVLTTPITFQRSPSVKVEKTPETQAVCAGEPVEWTITITNDGLCVIDNLAVDDTLGVGLSYDSAVPAPTVPQSGQDVHWVFEDIGLLPGQSTAITLTAIADAPCAGEELPNNVTVLAESVLPCDPPGSATDEDSDVATVTCLTPDVTIQKSLSEEIILPTETTTVTLLVTNTGSSILDPVTVTDQIDDGATFDDTQTIGGSCGASVVSFVNGLITFSDFSLGVGESCMITYEVGCSETSVELPDTAKVVAYCQGTFPDNPVEDEDYASFTCSCPPDVRIEKDVTPELINAGEVATVTLRIYNDGTTTLDPIDVCDKLDSGVGFDETQTIGGTCGVGLSSTTPNADGSLTICFDSFSLLSGESCSITYEVTCVETGEHPDTATVVAHCQGGLPTDIDEDEAYASFRCACPPDVELSKRIEPNTISDFDDRATVTLTVMNVGDTELDPVEVCDKIENGVGFDETQTIQGSCGVGIDDITTNADGSFTVCFEPFSLGVGESCTIIYEIYCIETGTHPDTATVIAKCKGGEPEDVDEDMAVAVLDCRPRELCWMTAGGHNSGGDDAGKKYWNWGGNVGPPPSGEWQHWERTYDDGDLVNYQEINFHAHDVNIDYCEQIDPGPCHPSAPVNTIHFFGTGTYNLGKGKKEYDAEFVARVEDHNEPGNTGHEDQGCDPGEPDVYYIKVWKAGTDPSDPANVVIEHTELIDGGNLQIHELKENQIRDDRVGRTDLGTTGSGDAFEGDGMDIGRLQLYSPTPNPFNHDTRIAYAVAGTGEPVEIGIYNVAGRLVRKLVSGQQTPGYHEVTWDARSDSGVQVAPGVYFLRAIVGSERVGGSRILYLQ